MKGIRNTIVPNLYDIGDLVKLNKEDIDNILNKVLSKDKQISLSLGPPEYSGGGFYGSVSIYDFFSK